MGLVFANLFLPVQYYSIHRTICRPSDLSVVRPPAGQDSNPGRADLPVVAGTITTRPPHLISTVFMLSLSNKPSNNDDQ